MKVKYPYVDIQKAKYTYGEVNNLFSFGIKADLEEVHNNSKAFSN